MDAPLCFFMERGDGKAVGDEGGGRKNVNFALEDMEKMKRNQELISAKSKKMKDEEEKYSFFC